MTLFDVDDYREVWMSLKVGLIPPETTQIIHSHTILEGILRNLKIIEDHFYKITVLPYNHSSAIFFSQGSHHRGAGQVGQHRRRDLGQGYRPRKEPEDSQGLRPGPRPHCQRVRGGIRWVQDRCKRLREPS